jgi:glutaredoxin-related protein
LAIAARSRETQKEQAVSQVRDSLEALLDTPTERLPIEWINPNEAFPLNSLGLDSEFLDAYLSDYWHAKMYKNVPKFWHNIPVIRQRHKVPAALEKKILELSYAWMREELPRCSACHQKLMFKTRNDFFDLGMPKILEGKKHCPECLDIRATLREQGVDISEIRYKPSAKPGLAGGSSDVIADIRAGMHALPEKARQSPVTSEEAILLLSRDILEMFSKGYSLEEVRAYLASHGVIIPEAALAIILLSRGLAEPREERQAPCAPVDLPEARPFELRLKQPGGEHGPSLSGAVVPKPDAPKPDVVVVKGYGKHLKKMIIIDDDPKAKGFWDAKKAARYLGVPDGTLSTWRYKDTGPMYFKHGGRVWYDKKELDDFKRTQIVLVGNRAAS